MSYNIDMASEMPRRRFVKLAALTAAGIGLGTYKVAELPSTQEVLSRLDNLTLQVPDGFPANLVGISGNAPYLWTRSDEQISKILNQAASWGIKTIRLLPDNLQKDEPELSEYGPGFYAYLEGIKKVADLAKDRGIGIIVDFFDGHYLTSEPTNSYRGKFFEDDLLKASFMTRVDTMLSHLSGNEGIAGWTIANELPCKRDKLSIARQTEWYRQVIQHIRDHGETKPIFTGLEHPDYVNMQELDGLNVIHTAHRYPHHRIMKGFNLANFAQCSPLAVAEIGIPSFLPSKLFPGFLERVIEGAQTDSELALPFFGFWQIDADHNDGFVISSTDKPEVFEAMQILNDWYQRQPISDMHTAHASSV